MKKKKLFDYTAGYRGLIILGILCSAGEAVLELLLPQVMSDIVDIGIQNGDRDYILMAGLKMMLMALVALAPVSYTHLGSPTPGRPPVFLFLTADPA